MELPRNEGGDPTEGVGAWTVAMETDSKLTSRRGGRLQAALGDGELVPCTLHSPLS